MGQKVSPISFRQGMNTQWQSSWFARRDYARLLLEDIAIRRYIMKKLARCFISKIMIKREKNLLEVTIYTARPGMIIGRSGAGINQFKQELLKLTKNELKINIEEIKEPNLDANLTAYTLASQIEKRISYKRAMKQLISRTMSAGALGVKVICKGRLAGVEIAREEGLSEGRIPLNTITANIDFAKIGAKTPYGIIGVKVWIHRK